MSLLDIAAQALGGANTPGGSSAAIGAVMNMVNSYPGGIGGLVSCLEKNGLGGVASSWVGSGPNQPVSPQQVQSGLGNQAIQDRCFETGRIAGYCERRDFCKLLPHVVDLYDTERPDADSGRSWRRRPDVQWERAFSQGC